MRTSQVRNAVMRAGISTSTTSPQVVNLSGGTGQGAIRLAGGVNLTTSVRIKGGGGELAQAHSSSVRQLGSIARFMNNDLLDILLSAVLLSDQLTSLLLYLRGQLTVTLQLFLQLANTTSLCSQSFILLRQGEIKTVGDLGVSYPLLMPQPYQQQTTSPR